MDDVQRVLLALLLVFVAGLLLGRRRVGRGKMADVRLIPGFRLLRAAAQGAIETGRPVHVGLGRGAIWGAGAADSLAGLEVLESVAAQTAPLGSPPIVTTGDATLLPLAEDAVRRACRRPPAGVARPASDVRWLSPTPAAYAAGVAGVLADENVQLNAMVGAFGDEYLLLAEAGIRCQGCQVGGASDPAVLPFVYATSDEALLGEEIYAAGAYLSGKPWHLASLWAQDLVRWIVVLAILGVVLANMLV
jgi:hypothetical protein